MIRQAMSSLSGSAGLRRTAIVSALAIGCGAIQATVDPSKAPAMANTSCSSVASNLVQNCSFETPIVGSGGDGVEAPGTNMEGWIVGRTLHDAVGTPGDALDLTDRRAFTLYPVADGNQSLDLNRDHPGGVHQALSTTPGQPYQLSFELSGYPASRAVCPALNPQTLTVTAGSSRQSYAFTPNAAASQGGNQPFVTETMTFVAAGSSTILSFNSTVDGCAGPIIDNVIVTGSAPSPPHATTITNARINRKEHTAAFWFKAVGQVTGFQCELIGPRTSKSRGKAAYNLCKPGRTYAHLKPGQYTFKVRAVNSVGPDPTHAVKRFRI